MASVRKTQKQKVLGFLASGKQITEGQARRLGVSRLSARIHDLRNDGFTIYTNQRRMRGGANRGSVVTAYRLADVDQNFVVDSGLV
jgi:hypothetical protein